MVLLFLGACSEGVEIGRTFNASLSPISCLKISFRYPFWNESKLKHMTYSKRLSLMIHIRFLYILPNKPWVIGGGGPLLPRDATFDQLHSRSLRGFLDFAGKKTWHFLDETRNLLGKGVG